MTKLLYRVSQFTSYQVVLVMCICSLHNRNYNVMSVEDQEEEMARVRAFSRALFYNIKGDEDR